jgi:hypothetical protein
MRLLTALTTAFASFLLLAPAAIASEGGEGLYGKTDDKVITNFGYGLMVGFALLVTLLSVAQYLLEKRKRPK